MDEITRQVGQEARTALQTSLQVARFLADVRRRAQERARRASAEEEARVRRVIEEQRRLADPVLRRGLDDRFWESAQPTDAAYVYGVAARFSDVDPLAAQAAQRCRDEARQRWDVDLDAPAPPVGPGDVDDATLAAVAPVVPGEEGRDLRQDLAASARTHQDGAGAAPAGEEAAGEPTQALDPVAAEEEAAWSWAAGHYDTASLWPGQQEEERRRRAHVLLSSLAAEGWDTDHPPQVDTLGGDVVDEEQARAGTDRDFAAATGAGDGLVTGLGADQARTAMLAWEAEQAGRYPDPLLWGQAWVDEGSRAVRDVADVAEAGAAPPPAGTWTALARTAAAKEARAAGMSAEDYLSRLQPHQRRAVIVQHASPGPGSSAGRGRMAAYRIACARAARPPAPEPPRPAHGRQEHQDQAGLSSPAPTQGGDGARPGTQGPGRGTAAGGEATALVPAASAAAETHAWDSPQAREAWADGLLAQGHDPLVVAAALAGDRALHEPAHRATAPAGAAPTGGRRPPGSAGQARTHRQRV